MERERQRTEQEPGRRKEEVNSHLTKKGRAYFNFSCCEAKRDASFPLKTKRLWRLCPGSRLRYLFSSEHWTVHSWLKTDSTPSYFSTQRYLLLPELQRWDKWEHRFRVTRRFGVWGQIPNHCCFYSANSEGEAVHRARDVLGLRLILQDNELSLGGGRLGLNDPL